MNSPNYQYWWDKIWTVLTINNWWIKYGRVLTTNTGGKIWKVLTINTGGIKNEHHQLSILAG